MNNAGSKFDISFSKVACAVVAGFGSDLKKDLQNERKLIMVRQAI